ncbi:acyl carrier protein [Enterococcus ureasiticus]|uniref:Carrier domain-containing protein n=1 Tax=Enterococcus ureasiticus TaxID=903984 RepID=A0A1E5GCB1_9ENTE|nr:phosphopantetheine-binding protein [Enterococcus ureasiticus]OEG10338.1 hypothetical protein BCR21_13395 [Enterococcus ureasiticus]
MKEKKKIESILILIINELKDYKNLDVDTDIVDDLNFDSLEIINLLVIVEDKFDMEFDGDDMVLENVRTIGLLSGLVIKQLDKR